MGAARADEERSSVSADSDRGRWHVDASWGIDDEPTSGLESLRRRPVASVDLNGNPLGAPTTDPLILDWLPTTTGDARVPDAISTVLARAGAIHAGAVVIENRDCDAGSVEGREQTGSQPSRGRRGRTFRRHSSGLPTAKLRDRMVRTAHNSGIAVIAGDPVYTPRWGAQHWLAPLKSQCPRQSPTATTRRRWRSGDAGSDTQHGDGDGVTRPTPSCGPCQHPPACPNLDGTEAPPGPRAATSGAQDPTGRSDHPLQPGGPRPFGGTRQRLTLCPP